MATVIDFSSRQNRKADLRRSIVNAASGKRRIESNPRNRYDAGFKAQMTRRAQELINALESSLWSSWRPEAERRALVEGVIAEIRAIRDEVHRTTPEHHPPTAS